jgi:transposase
MPSPTTGASTAGQEIGRANIFIAAMGVSGYCFCLATPAQTAQDWLGATAQALTCYGGVPQLIVPDTTAAQYCPHAPTTRRTSPRWN